MSRGLRGVCECGELAQSQVGSQRDAREQDPRFEGVRVWSPASGLARGERTDDPCEHLLGETGKREPRFDHRGIVNVRSRA